MIDRVFERSEGYIEESWCDHLVDDDLMLLLSVQGLMYASPQFRMLAVVLVALEFTSTFCQAKNPLGQTCDLTRAVFARTSLVIRC